jgi:hypothetical protein
MSARGDCVNSEITIKQSTYSLIVWAGSKFRCASNHLIVSGYRVPQMQSVGCVDVLCFKVPDNKADAIPCERLRPFNQIAYRIERDQGVDIIF